MFHPENNETKTSEAVDNLAEAPKPDIPVETEDSSVGLVILHPNFELKYFPIFKLSIGPYGKLC